MKAERSEARNSTNSAISSGVPLRPMGVMPIMGWRCGLAALRAVTTSPGHTAFTRMPRAAYAMAALRVSPRRPHLLAV